MTVRNYNRNRAKVQRAKDQQGLVLTYAAFTLIKYFRFREWFQSQLDRSSIGIPDQVNKAHLTLLKLSMLLVQYTAFTIGSS